MATESLIVELDAKTQKLDAALKESTKRLDDLEKSTNDADKSLADMAKTAVGAGVKIATGALAAASAISAIVIASAKSVRELEILSNQAKLATSDFNSLAFATKQYGVDAEQIADISKTLTDRLGEFTSAGTGAFQDFVDVVGLSTEEAISLATEFENLSSDNVLGKMTSMMEGAGASANEMTFVFESITDEASRLIPLFSNQSEELNKLRDAYDKINGSMELTKEQQEALTQTAQDWDALTTAMGNSANLISATLAPTLSSFFNGVIEVVPSATQAIVDFINSFKDADNINSIDALRRQIAPLELDIAERAEKIDEAIGRPLANLKKIQTADQERLDSLNKQLEALQKINEEEKKIAPDKPEGGEISGSATGENVFTGLDGSTVSGADAKSEIDLMIEQNALKAELLNEAGATEFEILTAQKEREQEFLQQKYSEGLIQEEDYLKAKNDLDKIYGNAQEKIGKDTFESLLSAGATQSRALFEANKIYTASQVALKIPEAVQNSYAWGTSVGGPVAGAAAGAVALSASLLQLKSIASTSFGGGSNATAPSGGSVNIPTQAAQEEAPTVSVSETDIATGQSSTVILRLDNDTDLATGILEGTEQANNDGRGDLF